VSLPRNPAPRAPLSPIAVLLPTLTLALCALALSACGGGEAPDALATDDVTAAACDAAGPASSCAKVASGTSCKGAIPLALGTGQVAGTTVGFKDHGTGKGTGCSGVKSGGPDRIYTFTLAQAGHARVEMIGDAGYDTVLHLRTACNVASQVACNDNGDGTNALLDLDLPVGTYFLYTDSATKTGGTFTLKYTIGAAPPPQDPCTPNPCTQAHKTVCTATSATQYTCGCDAGYDLQADGSCTPSPTPTGAEWTFLVYLNADNNLESYGFTNLTQMQAVGSSAQVNIVVLMDTASANSGHARKLFVQKGGSTVLADLGEIDMGIPQTLGDFGVWGVTNYPAKHYALDMWDHGGGWTVKPGSDGGPVKDFSNDDSSGNSISVAQGQYASALKTIAATIGHPIDVVGFDACLMGMWEIANASAPYANVLIGSEETEPGAGWEYTGSLAPLIAKPTMTGIELGNAIVDAYVAQSSAPTLATIDLTTIAQLNAVVDTFATELIKALPTFKTQLSSARDATQSFAIDTNRDLYDFASRVAAIAGIPASLKAAAQAVMTQVTVSVPHNGAHSDYPGAHGLAVYLKQSGTAYDTAYDGAGATWSQLTHWDEFLKAF
jgi:hypothetical protein